MLREWACTSLIPSGTPFSNSVEWTFLVPEDRWEIAVPGPMLKAILFSAYPDGEMQMSEPMTATAARGKQADVVVYLLDEATVQREHLEERLTFQQCLSHSQDKREIYLPTFVYSARRVARKRRPGHFWGPGVSNAVPSV